MTIAPGNAAPTEHKLQQSANIFLPQITDNKANREIILPVLILLSGKGFQSARHVLGSNPGCNGSVGL